MGLKTVRAEIVAKLSVGQVQHDTDRSGCIDEKNWLAVGKVTTQEVSELLLATKGDQFVTEEHEMIPGIDVHIFKPERRGKKWYIKCYLIEPDVWFISVH